MDIIQKSGIQDECLLISTNMMINNSEENCRATGWSQQNGNGIMSLHKDRRVGWFVNLYKLFTKSVMIFNTWKDYNIGNGGNL